VYNVNRGGGKVKRTLARMLKEMGDAVSNDDYEVAHGNADNLLIELIEKLVDHTGIYETEVVEILEEYKKVGKWYA